MPRRYLTENEAVSALNRGKEVEVFIGGFKDQGEAFIRWASFSKNGNEYIGRLWEAADEGGTDYLDVYSFRPKSGEWDVPEKEVTASSLEEVFSLLNCALGGIVNHGMVQDEYAEFKAAHNK